MSKTVVLFVGLVAACCVPDAVAHDGHSETVVISGTIQAIDSNQILINALDDESFHLKHVWIVTTESTRYKRGKSRVGAVATELMTGDRISRSPPASVWKMIRAG
jgi:hypothetical protein